MSEHPKKPSLKSRWEARFKALVRVGLISVFVSFLLSLTSKDYFPLTATFVYATPWLIQLLAAVFAIIVLRKQLLWISGILLLFGLYSANESYRQGHGSEVAKPGSFTIATWNAGRKLDKLRSEWHFESDVIAIIESGSFDKEEWRDFQAVTPEYRWLRFDGGTMLGVRGTLATFEDLGEPGLFRCFRVKVTIDGMTPFTVAVIDMRSQPWLSREEPMHRIFSSTKPGEPAIILGDFNTPPDSRWIRDNTVKRWSLANRSQSQGFIETWPYGLPIHCLDQIWISEEFQTLHFKQQARPSDHRLVEARLKRH